MCSGDSCSERGTSQRAVGFLEADGFTVRESHMTGAMYSWCTFMLGCTLASQGGDPLVTVTLVTALLFAQVLRPSASRVAGASTVIVTGANCAAFAVASYFTGRGVAMLIAA